MGLTLHTYFRSSASYRVRIALNLKGLRYEALPVHLNRAGGEHRQAAFLGKSPYGLLPVLRDGDHCVSQSLAIIEYLEERFPAVPLLPDAALDRARVRQMSQAIACDIHPLTNLRVLKYLTGQLGLPEPTRETWAGHWTRLGLNALENDVRSSGRHGRFCLGDSPTMADCCLVPLMFNARRFGIDPTSYPTLRSIENECQDLDAFRFAHPDSQPDAE